MTTAQLPSGSTMVNTSKVLGEITDYYLTKEQKNVASVFTVGGFGFSGQGQNNGLAFISLKPWSERVGEENSVTAIIRRAMMALSTINNAVVYPFNLPAVAELGTASGFDMELLDNGNLGHEKMMQARNKLLALANQSSGEVDGCARMVWKIHRCSAFMLTPRRRKPWALHYRISIRPSPRRSVVAMSMIS